MLLLGMTCYHPLLLKQSKISRNPKTGKPLSRVVRSDIDPLLVVTDNPFDEYIPIPCGRCIGCRIDKARDWSVRIMCESYTSSSSYFLTLTYDDFCLPSDLSLDKKHVTQFIKDLRNSQYYKYGISNIRYLVAGEYGDVSGRAHYHMILFNVKLDDLKLYKASKGSILYTSDYINDIWSKGYVVIGDVTPESASYVARYTLKKLGSHDYDSMNIQAPFIMMSTRPGIGYEYFLGHKQQLYDDFTIFVGHRQASLPKYFIKLLDKFGFDLTDQRAMVAERSFDKNFIKILDSQKSLKRILQERETYEEAYQKNKGDRTL